MWKDIIQTFITQNRFYKQTGRVTDITRIDIKNRVESSRNVRTLKNSSWSQINNRYVKGHNTIKGFSINL